MIKNIKKLPKRAITVDELLGFDDLNDIIGYLAEHKEEIADVCCVIEKNDGRLKVKATRTPLDKVVSMLEMAKLLMVQTEWFGLEG